MRRDAFKRGEYAVTPPNDDDEEGEDRMMQLVKIMINTVKQCVSTVMIGQRRLLLLHILRLSLFLDSIFWC